MSGLKPGTRDFMESKGVLAYANVPREVVLRAMAPDQCLESRLRHAMILCSWCGPQPSEAVVRKNAAGYIMPDGEGNLVPAQLRDFLRLLGMQPAMKGHVSRAAKALVAQNLLRFDGRTMYLVFKPSPFEPKKSDSVDSTVNWNIAGLVVSTVNLPTDPVARAEAIRFIEVASTQWKRELSDVKTRNRQLLVQGLSAMGISIEKSSKSLRVKDDERTPEPPAPKPAPEPVRPSVPSPPKVTLREETRRWLTARFPLPIPPDKTVMDQLMIHIRSPGVLSRFQAQIEHQRPEPDSWKYLVPMARACAHAEKAEQIERLPAASEEGVCPDCEGRGVVQRVIRGMTHTERCHCQQTIAVASG